MDSELGVVAGSSNGTSMEQAEKFQYDLDKTITVSNTVPMFFESRIISLLYPQTSNFKVIV